MLWAAEDAMLVLAGGDVGVPVDEVVEFDRSFAVEDGTGSHW